MANQSFCCRTDHNNAPVHWRLGLNLVLSENERVHLTATHILVIENLVISDSNVYTWVAFKSCKAKSSTWDAEFVLETARLKKCCGMLYTWTTWQMTRSHTVNPVYGVVFLFQLLAAKSSGWDSSSNSLPADSYIVRGTVKCGCSLNNNAIVYDNKYEDSESVHEEAPARSGKAAKWKERRVGEGSYRWSVHFGSHAWRHHFRREGFRWIHSF